MAGTEDPLDGRVGYPVISAVALRPLPRRVLRRRAREPEEIPVGVGSVLVAQFHDTYEAVPRRAGLTDRRLVEATALLLVSTQQRLVEASVVMPSADQQTGIEIRARFRCRVADPVALLDSGVHDIGPALTEYLLGYARVRMVCISMSLRDRYAWYQLQQRVVAMLLAYGEVVPVPVLGLSATLADVAVRALAVESGGLRVHPPAPAYGGVGDEYRDNNYTWGSQP
ncbi:hypothetical protein [Actinoplanes teichomyceticus]|uniref:Uncharacterized protein n=1 Tax=Actinoplanes teichomyceticus TaxID=1867 RepID=A0A561WKS2_ACTTI|nr:hypothetical protein [Actinoplanes teichomyceticus]TWG24467.1 hypothetical protein FHX34_1021023 [Actinoplanes teichomyceticus]GIF12682.1 hypothetical protein Ate01nite_27140 [Actinoplanes teichomyceticus]